MTPWEVPELGSGLVAGLVAAAACALASATTRRGGGRVGPLPVGGLAFAAAGSWVIGSGDGGVPVVVVVGVAGIALAAMLPAPVGVLLALPCAWGIGFHADVIDRWWVEALVVVAASGGALLAAAFDAEWRTEAPGPPLLALAAMGAYLAVPDTEQVAALFGVAIPIALLGWPLRAVRLGAPGAAAAVALLAWAGAIGGRARPASVVGALACLGLLVAAPLGRRLGTAPARAVEQWTRARVVAALLAGQLVIVLVASRCAGSRGSTSIALVVAATVSVAAVGAGAVLRPADA